MGVVVGSVWKLFVRMDSSSGHHRAWSGVGADVFINGVGAATYDRLNIKTNTKWHKSYNGTCSRFSDSGFLLK